MSQKFQHCLYRANFSLPINREKVNEDNDDYKSQRIITLLKKYHLSLYGDEIKDWENAAEIELKTLEETKNAISYLANDQFITYKDDIKYNNLKLNGGYKFSKKNKNLEVNFKYGDSKPFKIKFNVWDATRENVMKEIVEKINVSMSPQYYINSNWNSPFLTLNTLVQKFYKQIIKTIGEEIIVEDEKILINKYRISLNKYDQQINGFNHKIIYKFKYLLFENLITLKVNLIPKLNATKVSEKIITYLMKLNLLSINIQQKLDWTQIEDYQNKFETYRSNIWNILNTSSLILGIDLSNWDLEIVEISPFGPFDQQIIINFSLGKSRLLLPLTLNLNNSFDDNKSTELENAINKALSNLYWFKTSISSLSNQKLKSLITFILGNKLINKGTEVPFNSTLLTIIDYQLINNNLVINSKQTNSNKRLSLIIKTI